MIRTPFFRIGCYRLTRIQTALRGVATIPAYEQVRCLFETRGSFPQNGVKMRENLIAARMTTIENAED
jgi:hypothetical protein